MGRANPELARFMRRRRRRRRARDKKGKPIFFIKKNIFYRLFILFYLFRGRIGIKKLSLLLLLCLTCVRYTLLYVARDRPTWVVSLIPYIYALARNVQGTLTQLARYVQTMSRAITPWTHFARLTCKPCRCPVAGLLHGV